MAASAPAKWRTLAEPRQDNGEAHRRYVELIGPTQSCGSGPSRSLPSGIRAARVPVRRGEPYDAMSQFDDEVQTLRIIRRRLVPGARIVVHKGRMPL
jgi:hypothetical protein